jgi:hypothetical protein
MKSVFLAALVLAANSVNAAQVRYDFTAEMDTLYTQGVIQFSNFDGVTPMSDGDTLYRTYPGPVSGSYVIENDTLVSCVFGNRDCNIGNARVDGSRVSTGTSSLSNSVSASGSVFEQSSSSFTFDIFGSNMTSFGERGTIYYDETFRREETFISKYYDPSSPSYFPGLGDPLGYSRISYYDNQVWAVTSVNVTPAGIAAVPLPASGMLLFASFAALGFARKQRKV